MTARRLGVAQIGVAGPEQHVALDVPTVNAFASAVGSDRAFRPGDPVPLLYAVVPTRLVLLEALTRLIPAGIGATVPVLHGEHAIIRHRPLVAGDAVRVRAVPIAVEAKPSGTTATVRVEVTDRTGRLIEEQELTAFLPGVQLGETTGNRTTIHRHPKLPSEPDRRAVLTTTPDQSRRYARVSGDNSPFHVDDEAARRYGFPGVILHGLCTLGVALNAFPNELVRAERRGAVRVRFSRPGIPGEALTVDAWEIPDGLLFRGIGPGGTTLLDHGRLTCSTNAQRRHRPGVAV